MKLSGTKTLGLLNAFSSGSITILLLIVSFSGLSENSKCEYCTLMFFPALIFLALTIPGIYTLFNSEDKISKRKTLLNFLNILGAILSATAVIFNFTA